jgi:hypothetical protein
MRSSTRRGLAAIVLGSWLAAAAPAAAATAAFGEPTAAATFGQGVEFRQPVTITGPIRRAELLVSYPGAPGPEVRTVPTGPGASTLRYALEAVSGGLLPNTQLSARWRIVGEDGSVSLGPVAAVRYQDTRFAWQTRTSGIIRVHWYEGSSAFGDRALGIGTTAIENASRLFGVVEAEPLDFFVYASQSAFYDALGPGTRENVGGQANVEIRTLFALITPAAITLPWVETVITHELTHLVFDTAVSNPYHYPPRWLNEGLAVYLAQGYGASDRSSVQQAAASGSLMPLGALTYQFPTTGDRFALAYAESVAAVDYPIRTDGQAALVSLVRSYAGGVTDDEAFRAALGQDASAFDAAWRATLRAQDPVAYGPQPAPAGPLPTGWSAARGSGPTPLDPGASSTTGDDRVRALVAAGLVVIVAVGLVVLLRLRTVRRHGRDAAEPDPPSGFGS